MSIQLEKLFRLIRQRNFIDIDVEHQLIKGFVNLTVEPTSPLLTQIGINSQLCEIQKVVLNGEEAEFTLDDVETVVLGDVMNAATETNSHPSHFSHTLESKYMDSRSSRELHIPLKDGMLVPLASNDADDEPVSSANTEFQRIDLEITFVLRDIFRVIRKSVQTVGGTEYFHIFSPADCARYWFPCVDDLSVKCPWELTFVIPSRSPNDQPCRLVGSGQLVHESNRDGKTVMVFRQDTPLPACRVAFALGNFDKVQISESPPRWSLCPIGKSPKFNVTLENLNRIFDFFSWFLNEPFPFPSFSLVFVYDLPEPIHSGGLSIVDQRFLFDASIIDQAFATKELLYNCVAAQFFSVHVAPESYSDQWITLGICDYLAKEALRIFHGNNEYRFRLKQDMQLAAFLDVNSPPLCHDEVNPYDISAAHFCKVKASLVFFLLEQHLSKAFVQKIIICLLGECQLGLFPNGLSTNYFLKCVKKTTGKDLKIFADKWIYSAGIPAINCSFSLNRKSAVIEFQMRQTNPSTHPLALSKFVGPITVRVFEADGTYDHVIPFDDYSVKCELPFHTRFRKPRKRSRKPEDGGPEEEEEQQEDDQTEEKELDEEDLASLNSPILWIQIDPEMEWLMSLTLEQPDFMWIERLENDKDVISQYEAVVALEKYPSEASCFALERIVGDWKCFYRVRQEAAYSLASCTIPETRNLGSLKLIQIFSKKFCIGDSKLPLMVKPNNFEQFTNYFLQKSIASSMALAPFAADETDCPVHFLLNLLKFNDNSRNQFSDSIYLSAVVDALSRALTPPPQSDGRSEKHPLFDACVEEIERYRMLDLLFPSFQNVVTVSCLDALARFALCSFHSLSRDLLLLYSRPGNFIDVRKSALRSLTLLFPDDPQVNTWILHTLKFDPSMSIKEDILANWGMIVRCKTITASNVITKDQFWKLVSRHFHNPNLMSLLIRLGVILFRSVDVPSEERTSASILVLPSVPFSVLAAALREDGHELGSSDDENYTKAIKPSKERDWINDITGETPHSAPIISIIKTKMVDKPRIAVETPPSSKKSLKLKLPVAPSTPKIKGPEAKSAPIKIHLPKLEIQNREAKEGKDLRPAEAEVASRPEPVTPMPTKISTAPPVATPNTVEPIPAIDTPTAPSKTPIIKIKAPKKPETEMEFCKRILRKMRETKMAVYFNAPVDPVKLNIPIYFDIVKHPMDFETIEKKIDNMEYKGIDDFRRDVLLVFRNCFTFNMIDSEVYKSGRKLQQQFLKDLQARPPVDLVVFPSDETTLDVASQILAEIMQEEVAAPFLEPVDYVELNLPKYPDIVLRPMDLSRVKRRIEEGGYRNLNDIFKDSRQVFENCMDFNVEGSLIWDYAHQLDEQFCRMWNEKMSPLLENIPKKSQREVCGEILDKLRGHMYAEAFLYPVDYRSLNLPQYPKIIKKPMDFSTISHKIDDHKYTSVDEFAEDVLLVFGNCYTFNGPAAPISQAAHLLEEMFVQDFNGYFPDKAVAPSPMQGKKKK